MQAVHCAGPTPSQRKLTRPHSTRDTEIDPKSTNPALEPPSATDSVTIRADVHQCGEMIPTPSVKASIIDNSAENFTSLMSSAHSLNDSLESTKADDTVFNRVMEGLLRVEQGIAEPSIKASDIDKSAERFKNGEASLNKKSESTKAADIDSRAATTIDLEITRVCSLKSKVGEASSDDSAGIKTEEMSKLGAKVITITPVDLANLSSDHDRFQDIAEMNRDGTNMGLNGSGDPPFADLIPVTKTLSAATERDPSSQQSKPASDIERTSPVPPNRNTSLRRVERMQPPNTEAVDEEISDGENRCPDICVDEVTPIRGSDATNLTGNVGLKSVPTNFEAGVEGSIENRNALPLKSSPGTDPNLPPTQRTKFDKVRSSLVQDIEEAISSPIKRENISDSCKILGTLEVTFKDEPVEVGKTGETELGERSIANGQEENKDNITKVGSESRDVTVFPTLDSQTGNDMFGRASEFQLPSSEFQAAIDEKMKKSADNVSENQAMKKKKIKKHSKKASPSPPKRGKSSPRRQYWKKYVRKEQRTRHGIRRQWGYIKVTGSKKDTKGVRTKQNSVRQKANEEEKLLEQSPLLTETAGQKALGPHKTEESPETPSLQRISVAPKDLDWRFEQSVTVDLEKMENHDQCSRFKLTKAELTDKEKGSWAWKCFTKKCIREESAASVANIGYIAECRLCDYSCDYFETRSMTQIPEHMQKVHNVDPSKIRTDPKEDDMMKEKKAKLNLKSYVWNFFILGNGKDGERPTSTLCILCGSSLNYNTDSSTSAMRTHLKYAHKLSKYGNGSKQSKSSVKTSAEKQTSVRKNADLLIPVKTQVKTEQGNEEIKKLAHEDGKNDVLNQLMVQSSSDEKQMPIWKCFTKKRIKQINTNNPETTDYVVQCQLCKCSYNYHGKASLHTMRKHLNSKHNIQLSKMIINPKEEDIMKEKIKKLGLKSSVWKYFVMKKRVGNKPGSLTCVFCGTTMKLHKDSWSEIRTHLQSAHNMVLPATVTKKEKSPGQEVKKKSKKSVPGKPRENQSEEQSLVWKCFATRDLKVKGENGEEIEEKCSIAECQLCGYKCDHIGKSSMNRMVKHLKENHNVDATKIKIDPKDEEIMKEKIKKQRSISVVWKFFVLKEEKDADKPSFTKCILCEALVPYPEDFSTSKMRGHLQSFHNMDVPSTVKVAHDKRRSLVSCLENS